MGAGYVVATELADYLLFIGEAPPLSELTPRPGFADSLAAWALLTLIVGLVVTQVSTLVVVAHGRETRQQMMEFFRLAERVSSVTRAVATAS